MKRESDYTYDLRLEVRNRLGILVRCAQVLSRRGHNIESLHVKPYEGSDISRMDITAYGEYSCVNQIIAQLDKLVDVQSVTYVSKEVA